MFGEILAWDYERRRVVRREEETVPFVRYAMVNEEDAWKFIFKS